MSTSKSPQNKPRSKKITGGRVQCIVYLPKEEVAAIDKNAEKYDVSRSSIIAQTYFLGKKSSEKNKE